jgi:GNAT superfamily N-acetyltransferase
LTLGKRLCILASRSANPHRSEVLQVLAPWPTEAQLSAAAPLPAGYRYERLSRARVPALIDFLHASYPGIEVGNASCHLREDFYATRVSLEGEADRDFFVMLFMHGQELAGMHSTERDVDSEVLYGRIGAIAPAHRGQGLATGFLAMMEAMGRTMRAGMVYGLATLKYPQMQRGFERRGWILVGIMPGFDRELVEPGVVRRVYESVYVKLLIPESELLRPRADDLTTAGRTLFELLYPGRSVAS